MVEPVSSSSLHTAGGPSLPGFLDPAAGAGKWLVASVRTASRSRMRRKLRDCPPDVAFGPRSSRLLFLRQQTL